MHLKRTATLTLVGAALLAWLAAAATSVRHVVPDGPAAVITADTAEAALAAEVARLHERLAPSAAPNQPGRDLFRFAQLRIKAAPASAPAAGRPALSEALPIASAPERPVVKLDGIAEDVRPDAVVRTAILATQGQLFLAREGEAVTARFRVTRIAADVVELVDLTDNAIIRLALK